MFKLIISVIFACLILTACTTQNGPSTRGNMVRVDYAQITEIRRIQMPTAAPAGAMVGGFTGLILSSGRSTSSQIASGIGGAALGALATSALEGDRRGYSYDLRFLDGSLANFTTEKGFFGTGDCVSVERGQYANIRRVPASMCANRATTVANTDHVRMAQQCIDAKDQLLASETPEEIELARQKISILCQDFDG